MDKRVRVRVVVDKRFRVRVRSDKRFRVRVVVDKRLREGWSTSVAMSHATSRAVRISIQLEPWREGGMC